MQKNVLKAILMLAVCLLLPWALTGCKPSEKKVISSSYYKELNKKYKKEKKQREKLEKELAGKDAPTEDEKRAADYLAKISRDRLVSLEVGYADNMEDAEVISDKVVYPAATAIAKRADLTSKYTPEQVEKKYGPGYEYVLYDEDNAVYEIVVYGGNYVVFTDLPNNVYYAYGASTLGDAFLHYRDGYPNSRLLHRLADSALIKDDANCYENDSAFAVANGIRMMDKKKSSRKKADKAWLKEYQKKNKKSSEKDSGEENPEEENAEDEDPDPSVYEPEGKDYTFFHHGNEMVMTLYRDYICIKNMDGKETWYKAEPEMIEELQKKFVVPEEQAGSRRESGDKKDGDGQSHEKEIEEESAGS